MSAPTVEISGVTVGGGRPLVLIAGPCVVEEEGVMREAAQALREMAGEQGLPLIFKSSCEKDNRSDVSSYRGPGMAAGLEILAGLRAEHGFPVTTDVHRVEDVPRAAATVDLLQVPAFLCRQSSLLEAVGRGGRPVNLKKGQFMSPRGMAGSVAKVRGAGESRVLLTERGSSFGYERLVCDLAGLVEVSALGCPLVLDAGHAAPSREAIPLLARASVAAGVDALFVECHPRPAAARCDGSRMLSLSELAALVGVLGPLARLVRELGGLAEVTGNQPSS